MDGAAGQGHQLLEGAVGVAEDAGVVGVVQFGGPAQGRLGRRQPVWPGCHGHQAQAAVNRCQHRRLAAGQGPFAQARGQAQHRALVAHHLGEKGPGGPAHGKHGAHRFPHRRQLGRIAHEHQPGAEGVGAAQADLQQAAVHHGGLINQHQAQVFQGHGGLLRFLAALQIALAPEFEPQQPVDRGRKPGGLEAVQGQLLAQHAHGLVGGGHHCPAEAGGLHLGQQVHGEEGFAGAGKAAQHKGRAITGRLEPGGEGRQGLLLARGERCLLRAWWGEGHPIGSWP